MTRPRKCTLPDCREPRTRVRGLYCRRHLAETRAISRLVNRLLRAGPAAVRGPRRAVMCWGD